MQKPDKTKLLLFATFFYPRTGGVEKVVFNLIKVLTKKGFDLTIITKKHDSNSPNFEIINGAKVYRIPRKSENKIIKMLNIWKWIRKNKKLISETDILQYHDQGTFLWTLPLFSTIIKKPKFAIFHGYESFPVKFRFKLLRLIVSKLVDDYACISKSIENYYPVKSKNVFYNGVEKVIPNCKKTKDICFIARIESDTFLMEYLKSLLYIKEKHNINFNLDVYGEGVLRKECEQFVKTNKLKVKFFGHVLNADKFIKNYRYMFTTQYLSTVESMANRALVFTITPNKFKEGFAKEILQNGKLGIMEKDYKKLAEKLLFYEKNNDKYKDLIESAANYARSITWDNLANNLFIPIYSRLIKNAKLSRADK